MPVGTDDFVDLYLREKSKDITEKFERVKEILDPAAARLPGAGFRVLHNDAVHLTRSMMREGGFVSDSEAWNMYHGKVPSPHIEQYSTAVNRERGEKRNGSDRRQCMVPDIIAYNWPSSDHPRRAGRNCSTAPAIFEMKTISACPTRYNLARTKAVEIPCYRHQVRVRSKGQED